MPANMPPPTGPEGSNYIEDPSVRSDFPPPPPPITLASFQGNNQTNGFPPDPHLAVGPNHIIQVINSSFRISDKAGNTIKTIGANSWYQSTLTNSGPFDPKVFYDHHANRWLMVWDNETDATQTAYFLVSVSDDDNPIGVWFNWALPANMFGSTPSGSWQDYPGVGYDRQAYYITGRHFGFTSGYSGNAVRIMPKAQFLGSSPGPITWTDFWALRDLFGNDVDGIRPSVVYSAPNEYYLAGPPSVSGGTYFAVYRITNVLATPSISCVHVAATAWSNALNAGQLGGGSTAIEAGSSRVRHEPIYRDSSLWMAHSVNNSGYSAIRYVRINTVTNTTVEDVALGAVGFWHFYPALIVDKDNNVAITFSRSGDTEYIGAYYTWRLSSDPPGLRPAETMHAGGGNYVVLGSGRNRWGDYMGAALDPADKNNLWFLTEYAANTNAFAEWVQGVRLVPFSGPRYFSTTSSIGFGNVEAGATSDTAAMSVYNIGSSSLSITSIARTQSAYTLLNLPSLPASVATFDSIRFRVVFRPTAHGAVNDTIAIANNDPGNPSMKIPLQGKGIVIGRAQVAKMYSTSSSTTPPSQLYTVDQTTGVPTAIGPTGATEIQSLAIRPTTQELYGALTSTTSTTVYRMSSIYGDALATKTFPIGNMRAIAFNRGDSLYGGTTTGRLYRLNLTTGDTIYIGTAPTVFYSGLSFSPITRKLYASVRPPITGRDNIFTVDITNGDTAFVGATGFSTRITPGIAFNKLGALYGITGSGSQVNELIRIDTSTGVGTLIASTGLAGLNSLALRTDSLSTSVELRSMEIPGSFVLEQNYPNPFNPSTNIGFRLPAGQAGIADYGLVSLKVFDLLGREVATLVNEVRTPGVYRATFDAQNLSSGLYFYRLRAGSFTSTKKFVVLK
jgi:hypothetical protein